MSSRTYFDQVAGDWDRMRAGFYSEAVRRRALELAGIGPGRGPGLSAADLGAGSGFVTEALLAAGLSVACVDQSPEMLALLARKFGPGVTLHQGSAPALPLPDAGVDFVFANMFLHHVDDPALALAEMARIVRPGGRVVVTDLDAHGHEFLLREHHDRWPGFARGDVADWMRAAGLAEVSVGCAGENCCASACDGSDAARVSIFAASAMRPLLTPPAEYPEAAALAAGRAARALFDEAAPLLCAESVLLAVSRALGVASPLIPRLATGFCSGLSRTSGPCGALSGGVMALGLALGRDHGRQSLDPAYEAVQEFRAWFMERFGSDDCHALTGCDFATAEGQQAFRENAVKGRVCLPLVEAAAAEVLRLVLERSAVRGREV